MPDIISFPALGLNIPVDPILTKIGPIDIHWYGIIIAVAFLVGGAILAKTSPITGINADRSFDVLMGAFVGGVLCARLYYVAFTWDYYKEHMDEIFHIWEGGLAIYGGLIGGVLTGMLICRIRRVKILPMLDCAGMGLLVGQAIGRWGNFINMEAFGGNTTLPWGMTSKSIAWYLESVAEDLAAQGITVDPALPVHPTFLYESLWNTAGFLLIVFLLLPRRKFDGQVFITYVFWYGLGRAWIEGLRTDSLMWGPFRVSQLVAVIAAVVSLAVMVICKLLYKAGKLPPLYCTTEESALAVSGELYGKKPKQAEEPAEAVENDQDSAPLTEEKEEL